MTYRELKRKLREAGWVFNRQKGSHQTYRNEEKNMSITLAGHHDGLDVPKPILNDIKKRVGLDD